VSSPKSIRLTPQKMDEGRVKGICFNYDNEYSKLHKYNNYIDCEDEEDQEWERHKV